MPDFFIILLKINIVLVLFATAYYLILRRLTFYVINRIFLAFGILFSTIYPFIDLTDFFNRQNEQVATFVPKLNQKASALVPSDFIANYWQWISVLFYVGVVVMAFRLIMQFVSLYRMHQKSKPGSVANYDVRILEEPVSPFSFWQTVYINPALHKDIELKTILAHENIHVKEWHSLDIILAELSVVFYWFNPGVWLMKRAVKENLEFITDEKILKKGIDKKEYQYSLLDVGNLVPAVEIVNNFNLSDLKKRIKMMNVKRSSRLTLSRYLLVLPVLLATTLAFTVTKKDIKKHLSPIALAFVKSDLLGSKADTAVVEAVVKPTSKRKKTKTISIAIKPDSVSKSTYVINTIFLTIDTTDNAKSNVDKQVVVRANAAFATTGALVDSKGSLLHGKVTGFKLDTAMGRVPENSARVLRGVPTNNSPKEELIVIGYGTKKTSDSVKSKSITHINYVVNGKKITKNELSNIDPDRIKDIKVENTARVNEVVVIGVGRKQ